MANNPITLYREWKVPLSQSNYRPVAMQVSLFDLMFFTDAANRLCTRYVKNATESSFKSMGLELQHNIIVFDQNIYRFPSFQLGYRDLIKEDSPGDGGTTFEQWAKSGFDICLPKFDKRVKPLHLNPANVTTYIRNASQTDIGNLLTLLNPQDPDSLDFFKSRGFKIWDKDAALKPQTSFDFYNNSVLVPLNREEPNTWADYPYPWKIAVEEDYVSRNVDGADIILSNRDRAFEDRFLFGEYDDSTNVDTYQIRAYNGLCVNYSSVNVWQNLMKYYNARINLTQNEVNDFVSCNGIIVLHINPVLRYLLEHCYVWIKCSFFADYIDYRDFDQSLNKSAKVIHENLMLTKTGDFKRYNKLFSEGAIAARDLARASRPYLPSTTPSVDILRDTLLPTRQGNFNFRQQMDFIIENADDPHSRIGALPVEPLELQIDGMDTPHFTSEALDTPPQVWFDPESRKGSEDYNDFPILIPKDGNLIMNGRIISPTIDELWKMIKELAGGRKPDNEAVSENEEAGYPRGLNDRRVTVDTRPSIRSHKFKNYRTNADVIGDPTNIDYNLDAEEPHYEITSWINNPSQIEYNIIKELIDLNTLIVNSGNIDLIKERIDTINLPTSYNPSTNPWSLREIESQLKGLRWNLCYYITHIQNFGVYNGMIGRNNSDDKEYNVNAGGLYQLHKEYDAKNSFNQPNTVYDERYHRETISYGIGLGEITDDMTTDNKEVVPSWAVYLGADGKWHSTKQSTLIPVRSDEMF